MVRSLGMIVFSLLGVLAAEGAEEMGRFETTVKKQVGAHYLVSHPDDYDDRQEYPLLIFLHGRGEQGDDLEKVKIHGPMDTIRKLGLPLIVVAPQSPKDEPWDIDMLEAFVEHLFDELPVDRDRVYLTGLSLGGHGTWRLAVRRPDLFAAIVPICGYSQPSRAERLRDMGVWVFHGARDSTILLRESTAMVDALYAVGNDARLTIYPKAGHNSWTETYKNPALYEWLLSHNKRDRSR